MRILLCNDDEMARDYLAENVLGDHQVTITKSEAEAMAVVGCTYDLLVLAYSRIIDVARLVQHFRDQGVHTPVLVLLVSDRGDWRNQLMKFEGVSILALPYSDSDVLAVIDI